MKLEIQNVEKIYGRLGEINSWEWVIESMVTKSDIFYSFVCHRIHRPLTIQIYLLREPVDGLYRMVYKGKVERHLSRYDLSKLDKVKAVIEKIIEDDIANK